jgi:hypothetical protein
MDGKGRGGKKRVEEPAVSGTNSPSLNDQPCTRKASEITRVSGGFIVEFNSQKEGGVVKKLT